MNGKLLKAAEVATILDAHRVTVWRLVDAGKLKAVRLTQNRRGWRFTPADVQACIEACRSHNEAPPISSTSKSAAAELDAMLARARKPANLKIVSEPN